MMVNGWQRTALLLGAFLPSVGCGATLVSERMHVPSSSKRLPGLVVNQNVPHNVIAVFPTAPRSSEFTQVTTSQMLPSAEEVYVVGYRGQLFAEREIEVDLHPDTTIKRVKVGSKAQTDQIFTDLSAAATSTVGIKDTLAKKKVDPRDKENADRATQLCTDMLKVNAANAAAGEDLKYPTVTSCP